MNKRLKIDQKYLGKIFTSKHGEIYEVIEIKSWDNVTIKYSDGLIERCKTSNIRNGNPPNAQRITTCNRGFTGIGTHKISLNGVKTDAYVKWQSMLSRVYGKEKKSTLCYTDCSVNSHWFNFQNFAKWFENEVTRFSGYTGKICLDKDLLRFPSKEYSSETCVLLPYEINIAIQLIDSVYFDKEKGMYCAKICRKNDVIKHQSDYIGRYNSIPEVIEKYSIEKDKYICHLTDIYSKYLSDNTIHNLCNFNTKQRLQYKGLQ